VELLQPHTPDEISVLPDEEEDNNMQIFEIDDSGTDSDYDATSDTELLVNTRPRKRVHHYCEHYKEKCLQTFNILKLARLIVKRLIDCAGGFVACLLCLWTYDYTKCKPHNLRRKTSGYSRAFGYGIWRTFKLVLDRRVFLSVLLYAIIGFLAITSNEVS
jgi:hypothetical protein